MKRVLAALLLALLAWAVVWSRAEAAAGTITVGGKQFTESRLLGEIMAQLIEARTGLTVQRKMDLGGTKIVFDALRSGQVDLYAEYTGTGLLEILQMPRSGGARETYEIVREEFQKRYDVAWLDPLGFNNSYALAMKRDRARELGVSTISGLKGHPDLVVGLSVEFLNRADGWHALAEAYGLGMKDVRGMEHGLAYQAIAQGEIDLTDAYTTDGKLERFKLTTLKDDLEFFPPYYAAPVVRGETLKRHPEVGKALRLLGDAISDEEMQALNHQVEEEGRSFPSVASAFLEQKGLVDKGQVASAAGEEDRPRTFLEYIVRRPGEMYGLVRRHLVLTCVSVGIAVLVGIPMGIWITRWAPAAPPVLAAAGIIQTIPGLALLAFMIPIPGLGLGVRSAIVALSLYALLPIIRNTYTGIHGVDAGLLEAARGMGMKPLQVLTMVELPLAFPTIMAGIRTSAVITVGVATLAAFVGAGGLGQPILTGLYLNDDVLILAGAVPAALLAILVDQGLGLLERLLVPRGLGRRG